jgi:hypothetical protein
MTAMTSEEARELLAVAREIKPASPLSSKLLGDALARLMSGRLQERVAAEIRRETNPYRSIEIGLLSILAPLTWLAMVWNWRAG